MGLRRVVVGELVRSPLLLMFLLSTTGNFICPPFFFGFLGPATA